MLKGSKRSYMPPQLKRHGDVETLTQTFGHIQLTPSQLKQLQDYLESLKCHPTCNPCS